MSFTSEIKDELARIQNERLCCDTAELCGFVCFAGSVLYENGNVCLKITTESEAAAKRFSFLLKKALGVLSDLRFVKGKSDICTMIIKDHKLVSFILDRLGLYDDDFSEHISFRLNKKLIKNDCCKKALARGSFLGGGSATDPEKGYHLEFASHHKAPSEGLEEIFAHFGIYAKTIKRNSYYVTYFKNSEDISDVLSVIGAHIKMMDFANVRIVKDKRNSINRMMNCESANLDKTLEAALLQVMSIEKIKRVGMFDDLPYTLKEAAELRLNNPDAPLSTLAGLSTSGVSRSGINHRLNKLNKIAENLTEN